MAALVSKIGGMVVRIEDDSEFPVGSGFVADARGLVVTNAHVVLAESIQRSKQPRVRFPDNTRAPILGYAAANVSRDIVVLRVRSGRPFAPLTFAGSKPAPGDRVVSFKGTLSAHSWFADGTATFIGEIRSFSTYAEAPGLGEDPNAIWVETTAHMLPGFSGGPLINRRGEVVGMNTRIIKSQYSYYSYAVSADDIQSVLRLAGDRCHDLSTLKTRAARD